MTSPVRWESIPCISPAICPQLCTTPTPPFLPSQRLSADCLALSLLIRPIALCRRHAQHLSYHCLDNSLLVRKSLRARRSHDDDMVTLPGGFEPPAEIAYPFSSTSVSFFAHPSASLLLLPLLVVPLQALELKIIERVWTTVCKRVHLFRQTGCLTAQSLLSSVTKKQQIEPRPSSDTDTDLHETCVDQEISHQ